MKLIRYMYRIPLTIVLLLLIISAVIVAKFLGVSMGFRHRMFSAWRSMVLFTLGINVNVKGEMVRRAGIAMCNHRSYADAIFVYSYAPVVYLAMEELKSWPIFGLAASAMDTVFVDRSSKESRRAAKLMLADRVSQGMSPVVFPEGYCSEKGLLPFKPGMFHVAAEKGVPILPLTIEYSDPEMAWVGEESFISHLTRMLGKPSWSVDLTFGPAMEGVDGVDLNDRVAAWMSENIRH